MADQKKTRRVLRLNRVTGDGLPVVGTITLIVRDPMTNEDLLEPDGSPAVTIQLRPIDDVERAEIGAAHRTYEKDPNGGRMLFEVIDQTKVADEILRRAIVSWQGLVGADDQPLVCTNATKVLLDAFLRVQVTRKLFGAEAVEVLAESFREPAGVPGMVRG
jgi:hypothetical protein